jgi:quinol monooxygenase YgiN
VYIIIWKYRVDPGRRQEFLSAYGREGCWVKFFRGDDAYLSTELFEDVEEDNIFLTIDMWKSRESYDVFRNQNVEEYGAIDRECEELTLSEVKVGDLDIEPGSRP